MGPKTVEGVTRLAISYSSLFGVALQDSPRAWSCEPIALCAPAAGEGTMCTAAAGLCPKPLLSTCSVRLVRCAIHPAWDEGISVLCWGSKTIIVSSAQDPDCTTKCISHLSRRRDTLTFVNTRSRSAEISEQTTVVMHKVWQGLCWYDWCKNFTYDLTSTHT